MVVGQFVDSFFIQIKVTECLFYVPAIVPGSWDSIMKVNTITAFMQLTV